MNHAALAYQAHQENRVADAARHYRLFLAGQPDAWEGWLAFGMLLHRQAGDTASALSCYRKALDLSAEGAMVHLHLGLLLCETGDLDGAVLHLEKALVLDPDGSVAAYSELACAYVQMQRLGEAEAVTIRFRHRQPDDFAAAFVAAWVAGRAGHLEDALYHVTDAVALDPLWPVPVGLRGMLLSRLGQVEEAKRALQEMVAIQGGLLSSGLAPEERIRRHRMWKDIRSDAKKRLGIRENEPANFIMFHGGLGDQFQIARNLANFKSENKHLPLVAVCNPSAKWEMLYPGSADLFLSIDAEQISELTTCNRFFPDHPYSTFFPALCTAGNVYTGYHTMNFFLGLPQHLRGKAPTIPDGVRQKSLDLFSRMGGIQGRSVLIAPQSNSNPMASGGWWEALVDEFSRAGFVVFQNITNPWLDKHPDRVSTAIGVDLPVEQVIPFCEAAGFFVGMRSGLCELVGDANARMKAIHVKERYQKNDRYPVVFWRDSNSGWSLRQCFETENWQDIDVGRQSVFDRSLFADWLVDAQVNA